MNVRFLLQSLGTTKQMKILLLLLLISNTLWSSQIAVGVNSEKIVIFEYCKFVKGNSQNEMLIYNPQKEAIKVTYRKWHSTQINQKNKVYAESDILLKIKTIKPNEYVLLSERDKNLLSIYTGYIEVIVNNKKAGIYNLNKKRTPRTKINKGILLNHIPNVGNYLPYEIIYKGYKYPQNKKTSVKVVFLDTNFYSSGFLKGEKYNSSNIQIKNISYVNLKIKNDENYDLLFIPTSQSGAFELELYNLNTKQKITRRNFNYRTAPLSGQSIAFFTLNGIYFNHRRKYIK